MRQTSVFISNQNATRQSAVELSDALVLPLPSFPPPPPPPAGTTCMHEYNTMQLDKWLIFDHRPRSATYPVSHNGKALIYLRFTLIVFVDINNTTATTTTTTTTPFSPSHVSNAALSSSRSSRLMDHSRTFVAHSSSLHPTRSWTASPPLIRTSSRPNLDHRYSLPGPLEKSRNVPNCPVTHAELARSR